MKQFAKRLLFAAAPRWTTALMSARARAHSHQVVKEWGCDVVNRKLLDVFGNTVQDGPFAGLVLSPMTRAEQLGPYLLGVYESELDRAWEIIFRGKYSQIIDIGAKFGYYAVGLARRYPDASVIAFDTDGWARKAVREMAAANGVGNVVVRGFCSPEGLVRQLHESALVISDCEGYEATLFDGTVISRLRSATILIETHDCYVPGVCARLRDAFAATHAVHDFGDPKDRRERAHGLDFLSDRERDLANHEVRPPQVWLLCVPETGDGKP